MAKTELKSLYFPHDYHARHDPKLELLRMDVGPVGDGIYWDLVEMLYEEGGFLPLKNIPFIAKTLNTTVEMVEKIVKTSELFIATDKDFYSESLIARLSHINKKRLKLKQNGRLGGIANAKQMLSKCLNDGEANALALVKHKKEEKRIEKKVNKIKNTKENEINQKLPESARALDGAADQAKEPSKGKRQEPDLSTDLSEAQAAELKSFLEDGYGPGALEYIKGLPEKQQPPAPYVLITFRNIKKIQEGKSLEELINLFSLEMYHFWSQNEHGRQNELAKTIKELNGVIENPIAEVAGAIAKTTATDTEQEELPTTEAEIPF